MIVARTLVIALFLVVWVRAVRWALRRMGGSEPNLWLVHVTSWATAVLLYFALDADGPFSAPQSEVFAKVATGTMYLTQFDDDRQ